MWITRPLTTRIIVWLAAITIPLQGMSSVLCGCSQIPTPFSVNNFLVNNELAFGSAEGWTEGQDSCCQSTSSCCASESSTESGCQCDDNSQGSCQCGDNCLCSSGKIPAEPTAPPIENSSPERVVPDSTSAASFSTVFLPAFSRQHLELGIGAIALTAHDCCVSLCRFTL